VNRIFLKILTCSLSLQIAFAALTVDDIIKMNKAGLGEDIIIAQLAKDNAKFDLSTDDLIKLKGAGISDKVIKALVTGNSAPAAVAAPASVEIGVMYKKNGEWVEVNPEVVNWKTGGVLKSMATGGIVKGDINGNVTGANSRNSVKTPLEFKIVTPEGVAITEYQLLRLHQNKDYREFRTVTGGVMHISGGATRDVVPFESKKTATRVFEIILPGSIGAGEYGFLPPGAFGSANSASIGKMYTFRLLE